MFGCTKVSQRSSKYSKFLRVDEKVYLYVSLALFFALCSYMGGTEVPADWRGALNLTYRYGGSLINSARYMCNIAKTLTCAHIY